MSALTAVLWLGDDPERVRVLRELREAMTPGERSRLNSPISARQRVHRIMTTREHGGDEEASIRESPVALLKKRVVELARENDQLKRKAESDGSRFDLNDTPAPEIADVIIRVCSEHKASEIQRHIALGVAAKRKARRNKAPAG